MTQSIAETAIHRVLTENPLTIKQAQAEIQKAFGRRVDKSTLCRWIHKGVKGGAKLEAVRIGDQLVTSAPAIHRFLVARTAESIGA